jgi:hypothetical protein
MLDKFYLKLSQSHTMKFGEIDEDMSDFGWLGRSRLGLVNPSRLDKPLPMRIERPPSSFVIVDFSRAVAYPTTTLVDTTMVVMNLRWLC